MCKDDIMTLFCEYARTCSVEALHKLCAEVEPFVRRSAASWVKKRNMRPHTQEEFVSYAIGDIQRAVTVFNGSGDLKKFVLQQTRLNAIHMLRVASAKRRTRKEIPSDLDAHPVAQQTCDPRPAEALAKHLDRLTPRERYVIETVFLRRKMQKDVATSLGITPSGLSRVISKAFDRIRERSGDA